LLAGLTRLAGLWHWRQRYERTGRRGRGERAVGWCRLGWRRLGWRRRSKRRGAGLDPRRSQDVRGRWWYLPARLERLRRLCWRSKRHRLGELR